MNIIFLDMDGVVNSTDFFARWTESRGSDPGSMEEFKRLYYMHGGYEGYVVPDLLRTVRLLAEETGSRIVWSSSWRERFLLPGCCDRFDEDGIRACWEAKGLDFGRYAGCTPCLNATRFSYVPRCREIMRWVRDHAEEYNMQRAVILDDDPDAAVCHPLLLTVLTDMVFGLTDDKAEFARRWLLDEV